MSDYRHQLRGDWCDDHRHDGRVLRPVRRRHQRDPYPVSARLREEAPLYYNEQHDFYAVSRFDDVERALVDRDTFISGRGGILELIKADIEMPPGMLIFEDPPTHTIHRRPPLAGLHAQEGRVARADRSASSAPQPRPARRLRRLRLHRRPRRPDADAGDRDAARRPEADQEAVRDHVDENLRTEAGQPMKVSADEDFVDGRDVRGVRRLAGQEPLRRPDDRPAATRSSPTRPARCVA